MGVTWLITCQVSFLNTPPDLIWVKSMMRKSWNLVIELGFTQGFCENICQLLVSRYMMKDEYLSLLDAFLNKVITNINVLGTMFLCWILH